MNRNFFLLFIALIFASTALVGCKSPEQKACENSQKIQPEDDYKEEECLKAMEEIKKECGDNGEAVIECFGSISTKEEAFGCLAKCKPEE